MRFIAGKDKRPLLVLRECLTCTGTEDALLTRDSDNERTYLLSQWFHCVKLPPDVLEDDHPFRNLFAGDKAAHLFVCNADGSGRTDLSGSKMRSRKTLWGAMEGAMKSNYKKDSKKPLRTLANLLDDLDQVDRAVSELETKLELAIAKDGPENRRTQKLMKKMADLRAKRTGLYEKVAEAAKLQLKPEVTKSDLDPPTKKTADRKRLMGRGLQQMATAVLVVLGGFASLAQPVQAQGGRKERPEVDPYTKGDAKAMRKAGYTLSASSGASRHTECRDLRTPCARSTRERRSSPRSGTEWTSQPRMSLTPESGPSEHRHQIRCDQAERSPCRRCCRTAGTPRSTITTSGFSAATSTPTDRFPKAAGRTTRAVAWISSERARSSLTTGPAPPGTTLVMRRGPCASSSKMIPTTPTSAASPFSRL